ncbi:hypothetical protein M9H77_22740 [Catharanthus roseus]|uniref:Uncharacterized protein n=1 Tax=Catharanthus roseus TaxID=4058 RepID=A0ACC0AQY6_CATRO|nr:hypothetical protein M9H77_22740 [Catharanthus roseus]
MGREKNERKRKQSENNKADSTNGGNLLPEIKNWRFNFKELNFNLGNSNDELKGEQQSSTGPQQSYDEDDQADESYNPSDDEDYEADAHPTVLMDHSRCLPEEKMMKQKWSENNEADGTNGGNLPSEVSPTIGGRTPTSRSFFRQNPTVDGRARPTVDDRSRIGDSISKNSTSIWVTRKTSLSSVRDDDCGEVFLSNFRGLSIKVLLISIATKVYEVIQVKRCLPDHHNWTAHEERSVFTDRLLGEAVLQQMLKATLTVREVHNGIEDAFSKFNKRRNSIGDEDDNNKDEEGMVRSSKKKRAHLETYTLESASIPPGTSTSSAATSTPLMTLTLFPQL